MKTCKSCKANCTGAGKEGNGNQCTCYISERKKEIFKNSTGQVYIT